ncbi:uncharacterized protein [Euphorbia lathyris]|uniref:uncharacterized protein n=1 Tax=Euphorbia lathyris TaxID=212925 RepID=UPI0033140B2C
MSGPPRIRSTNIAEPENKEPQNPVKKPEKMRHHQLITDSKAKKVGKVASSVLRQKSMNGSCSSDVSTDSSHSRSSSSSSLSFRSSSTGRITPASRRNGVVRKKQCEMKADKEVKSSVAVESGNVVGGNSELVDTADCFEFKKRCAWVTPSTDPCYMSFHDEEWGVPVHDDKKLFELLCLSGALAEMTWPVILNKRGLFREVFLDFDPAAVSKLNDRKIALPGSPGSLLLSESKLRSIIENARQMCKVIDEFGSFNRYIWNFVNHKPMVNQFRNSRQVQVKNSKAEVISKDLVRRGFRSVGPTVVYSFMQVAGLTNDHLTSCFRFQDCISGTEVRENDTGLKSKNENKLEASIGTG